MRDRQLREWKALVRERANREWRDLSSDVVDELACHLSDHYAAALRGGASDAEARAIALAELERASFFELSKRPRARLAGGYGHDVRLALRQLFATPIVTTVAVVSLALGIGANTAIFSLVNSLLLRELPVKSPGRLAVITEAGRPASSASWTYAIWRQVDDRNLFESAFAWSTRRFNLAERGETEFVDGVWTSAGIFDTLGVQPILGRGFTEADDQRGGGPDGAVAVISYAFWQRRFGGAADAVGRRLTLERVPFTIVGILPPDFFGPDVGRRMDIAIPIGTEPLIRGKETALDEGWYWWLSVMVRLKPGQSIGDAGAALRGVQPQIRAAAMPADAQGEARDSYMNEALELSPAASGLSGLRQRYQRPLVTIMVVVALVLLIACANIANLLLARATVRRHEMSVRLALGASRWRLARQLLTESLVLSSIGAMLGLLVARWGSRLLVQQLSTRTNVVFLELPLDWRVLGFTAAVTMTTALLFGLVPALRTSRVAPMEAIKEHGRGTAGSRRVTLAGGLVVAQVALSVVLVVAAALFGRTFAKLAARPLGFDSDRVLVTTVDMLRAPIAPDQRMPTAQRALDAVRATPGVASAGLSMLTPLSGMSWNGRFEVPGGVPLTGQQATAYRNLVGPGFFATYGTAILAGRDFAPSDRNDSPPVAIVNEAFARKFLNGANPIGHTVREQDNRRQEPAMEIVGLVADASYRSLRGDVPATIYTVAGQRTTVPYTSLTISVRAANGTPALLTRSIAAAINGVHPDLALTFRPLSDMVSAGMIQERVVAMLSGFFGGLALLLAGLGLYGVTAYTVSQRRAEIGIRMALGAAPSGVARLVLRRVAVLVAIGVAIGAGVSVWASQFVSSLLFGLEPRDPLALTTAAIALAGIGAMAGWIPARRASRIDPAEVLRDS